mgnify:CR=1 FL=1
MNTVFHQAEAHINKHYEIFENTVNHEFYIKSKNDKKNHFEKLNVDSLYIEIQKANIKLSINNLGCLLTSGFTKKVNPIQEYFNSLQKWNTKSPDYIKGLMQYIKTVDNDWSYLMLKKWMVRAVKLALFDKGYNKQGLIFASEGQNNGKSTLCRFLCPQPLMEYRKDLLSDVEAKDTRIDLARNFIINLDELSVMNNQKAMRNLKALMSIDYINERLPYRRDNSYLKRISSFVGSTDNFDFLKDSTGNVRWVCLELKNVEDNIDWKNYSEKVNIDNLWSQAFYLANDKHFKDQMTPEEIRINEEKNRKFIVTDGIEEIILGELKPGNRADEFMTSTQILDYLRKLDGYYYDVLKNVKAETLGKRLSQLGFSKDSATISKNGNSYSVHGYYVKKLSKPIF